MKRLIGAKKEAKRKQADSLDAAQIQFVSVAATSLRSACDSFVSSQQDQSKASFMKFIDQIIVVFESQDAISMHNQLKIAFSSRPNGTFSISNSTLPDSSDINQHPLFFTMQLLCQFFFHHSPRIIVRDLLKLLVFVMSNSSTSSPDSISLGSYTNAQFSKEWSDFTQKLPLFCLLNTDYQNMDESNETQVSNILKEVSDSINGLDVLWSILLSPIPQNPNNKLFESDLVKKEVLHFLARSILVVSEDQHSFDALGQFYPPTATESILACIHAYIKLFTPQDQLVQSFENLLVRSGFTHSIHDFLEQQWNFNNFSTLQKDISTLESDPNDAVIINSFGGNMINVLGAIMNGSLRMLTSNFCSKDTTHSAGLLASTVASIIFTSIGGNNLVWIQNQVVINFFSTQAVALMISIPSILNIFPSGFNGSKWAEYKLSFGQEMLGNIPQPAQLSLLRGILISLTSHVDLLIAPCPSLPGVDLSSQSPSLFSQSADLLKKSYSAPELTQMHASSPSPKIPSSILFDAALPHFFKLSEISCERYERFLAVKSVGACVELLLAALRKTPSSPHQITSYLKKKVDICMSQLFQLIWKNWEDNFESIVAEIWTMFPLLMDVGDLAYEMFKDEPIDSDLPPNYGPEFIHKLAHHLLSLDLGTKGKYPLIVTLLQRIGAQKLMEINPKFVQDMFKASSFNLAGRSVGPLIEAFLSSIDALSKGESGATNKNSKKRSKNSSSSANAAPNNPPSDTNTFKNPVSILVNPLLDCLLDEETLSPITLYALPAVFEKFPAVFQKLLFALTHDANESPITSYDAKRIRSVISVLKVARLSGLIDGVGLSNSELLKPSGSSSHPTWMNRLIPRIIGEALKSIDASTRIEALQLVIETRKLSELPSSLELESVLLNLDHNLLETSLVYRNRSLNLIDMLLLRLKDSIKHHYKLPARSLEAQQATSKDIKAAVHYLNEVSNTVLHDVYSPSPPHRRLTALEVIRGLVSKYGPNPTKGSNFAPYFDLALIPEAQLNIQRIASTSDQWRTLEIFSPAATLSMLIGLWDPYDAGRVLTFEVLKAYPSPLPGLEDPAQLERFVRWALASISSPRMREADSGSLALRLIAQKYIREAGWSIRAHLQHNEEQKSPALAYSLVVSCLSPSQIDSSSHRSLFERLAQFCHDLIDVVMIHITETRKNRSLAGMHFPVHGPLMALRYIINDVSLSNLDQEAVLHWKSLLERVIEVSKQVSSLALELKYPLRYTHNAQGEVDHTHDHDGDGMEGDMEGDMIDLEVPVEIPEDQKADKQNITRKKNDRSGGTTESIVVAAWLSLKEVAFLLGCIVKSVLSGATSQESSETKSQSSVLHLNLISSNEIKVIGQHLLDTLLVLRHRGAMETTSEGFQVVCESLMRSNDRSLQAHVHFWLSQLLDRIDNTPWALLSTRRSAGLPYAFLALLRSELVGGERDRISHKMLPRVFSHLLQTASRQSKDDAPLAPSSAASGEAKSTTVEQTSSSGLTSMISNPGNLFEQQLKLKLDADVGKGKESNHSPKEHRHQVHALNVIRAIIRDRAIISDISPYVDSVLTLVLKLYLSPHWSVQNSATMTFSTLLERSAGGSRLANLPSSSPSSNKEPKNTTSSKTSNITATSVPRTKSPKLTATDFFSRYPLAHSFLISSLSKGKTIVPQSSPNSKSLLDRVFRGVRQQKLFPSQEELSDIISSIVSKVDEASSGETPSEESLSSSLYAILLLLSRMSPPKFASPQELLKIAPFVELTVKSALAFDDAQTTSDSSSTSKHHHGMVRSLAAKALSPLISTPSFPHFLRSMIDAIPNSPEEYKEVIASSPSHSGANQLHGLLTIVFQLLKTHMPLLNSSNHEETDSSGSSNLSLIYSDILPSLASKLWILKSKVSPLSSLFLSIILEFIIIPSTQAQVNNLKQLEPLIVAISALCSLQLRRFANKDNSGNNPVKQIMNNVMLHEYHQIAASVVLNVVLYHSEIQGTKSSLISFYGSEPTVQSTISALLEFEHYEVRIATYKILLKMFRAGEVKTHGLDQTMLAEHLLNLIGFLPRSLSSTQFRSNFVETHPKCVLKIIKLLNILGNQGSLSILFEASNQAVSKHVWSTLQMWSFYEPDAAPMSSQISKYCKTEVGELSSIRQVNNIGVSASLRQEALIFAAFFLNHVSKLYSSSKNLETYVEMLNWWIQMVEHHSRYELTTGDREAAVSSLQKNVCKFDVLRSLASSDSEIVSKLDQICVDFWMLVLRLLQDDDEIIRFKARDISATLSSELNTSSPVTLEIDPGLMASTIECMEYLTKMVPTNVHYFKWLLTTLCPTASFTEAEPVLAKISDTQYSAWKLKLAFPTELFEQEKPNFFNEPVLLSQLASEQLSSIFQTATSSLDEHKALLLNYHTSLQGNLNVICKVLGDQVQPRVCGENSRSPVHEWQTMYEHVFSPLYQVLFALDTLETLKSSATTAVLTIEPSIYQEERLKELWCESAGVLHPILAGLVQRLLHQSSTPILTKNIAVFPVEQNNNQLDSKSESETSTSQSWSLLSTSRRNAINFLLPRPSVFLN